MEYKTWYRESASGEGNIYSCGYFIEQPKAVIQIAHGMCEHSGRYDEFARILVENGYAVCANDHLGHGESHMGHMGTFALRKGGFDYVIQDIHHLFQEMKEKYPDTPLVLLGHSMGSILAALFAEQYEYLDRLILMGTPVPNKLTGVADWLLRRNVEKHGYTYQSKLCNFIMWGAESPTIEKKRKSKQWLSYSQRNIENFIQDKKCDFSFTDSANLELVRGLAKWSDANWGQKITDIPILVIAGRKDSIGGNGKGPRYYYNKLKHFQKKVTLELLDKMKHEVLNEESREITYKIIINWLND